jgi:hypothetical protein
MDGVTDIDAYKAKQRLTVRQMERQTDIQTER